jgi:hypothetical protein
VRMSVRNYRDQVRSGLGRFEAIQLLIFSITSGWAVSYLSPQGF